MKHIVKNPIAKALRTARFRPKVIKIKTKYDRKVLKKGSITAPLSDSVYIVSPSCWNTVINLVAGSSFCSTSRRMFF